jgi:hypothetical protein
MTGDERLELRSELERFEMELSGGPERAWALAWIGLGAQSWDSDLGVPGTLGLISREIGRICDR